MSTTERVTVSCSHTHTVTLRHEADVVGIIGATWTGGEEFHLVFDGGSYAVPIDRMSPAIRAELEVALAAVEASCGGCGCADRLRADDVVEGAARQHAGLNPGEPWPSNAELGGGLTGTRDDEYRDAMRDEAKGMLSFAIAVLTDNHWHGGPDPCVPCSLDAAPDARGSDLSAERTACGCGHGWEYHGPEVPGCAECRCRRVMEATDG